MDSSSRRAELPACEGSGTEPLEVALVGATATRALRDAICDWFRDAAARVQFSTPGELPADLTPLLHAKSRFLAVTLPDDREARLAVELTREPGAPARYASRDVALAGGLDDAAIEVIAQALHSTVEAARSAEPDRAPREAPADAPARARPEQATAELPELFLHAGLDYELRMRGSEPVTHGPGARLELDLLGRGVVLSAFARAGAFTSKTTRVADLTLQLDGATVGGGLAASAQLGPVMVRSGLGPSIELLSIEAGILDGAELRALPGGRARPRGYVGAEAGLAWRAAALEVGIAATLRGQLSSSHYDIRVGDQITTVTRPWRWQPGATLHASYLW